MTHDTIRRHMQLRDDMLTWLSSVNGGAICALADAAFSVPANSSTNFAVALDCPSTYLTSPEPKTLLIVEGKKLSGSRRTGACLFKVSMDLQGKSTHVATTKSTACRTGRPIDHTVGH